MSKKYYVTKENSSFFVNRPNGCLLTCAANEGNAKHICAELNRLLHRIPAREEDKMKLFPPITLEDAIKNTESTSKYDPRRLFRKGDIVKCVQLNGRKSGFNKFHGIIAKVIRDESMDDDVIAIKHNSIKGYPILHTDAAYLELVTPVEELEPYAVSDDDYEYCVFDRRIKMTVCRFDISHPHALEAAEAERDRLNAEHRKEMEK